MRMVRRANKMVFRKRESRPDIDSGKIIVIAEPGPADVAEPPKQGLIPALISLFGAFFSGSLKKISDAAKEAAAELFSRKKWQERINGFAAASVEGKIRMTLSCLAVVALLFVAVFMIYICIGLIIAMIKDALASPEILVVLAIPGYIAYHLGFAKYITLKKYDKDLNTLWLPEGMNSEALFQALHGKFNYPYFKGVRYGVNGECIIQGKYTSCSVIFDGSKQAVLDCQLELTGKLRRALLETIAIRHYINKFFNPSLPFDAEEHFNALKSAEKHRKISEVLLSVFIFALVVSPLMGQGELNFIRLLVVPGAEVRGAYLTQYSRSITIEKAFDDFFEKGKWRTYKSEGNSYVVFTGVCEVLGERADIKIIFKILGENFIVDGVEINGGEQGAFMTRVLLEAVYRK